MSRFSIFFNFSLYVGNYFVHFYLLLLVLLLRFHLSYFCVSWFEIRWSEVTDFGLFTVMFLWVLVTLLCLCCCSGGLCSYESNEVFLLEWLSRVDTVAGKNTNRTDIVCFVAFVSLMLLCMLWFKWRRRAITQRDDASQAFHRERK